MQTPSIENRECTCEKRTIYFAGYPLTILPTTSYENCKICNPSQEKQNEQR